jgi:hypothetical protein
MMAQHMQQQQQQQQQSLATLPGTRIPSNIASVAYFDESGQVLVCVLGTARRSVLERSSIRCCPCRP